MSFKASCAAELTLIALSATSFPEKIPALASFSEKTSIADACPVWNLVRLAPFD